MYKSPKQFAKSVHAVWPSLVSGDYTAPDCPPIQTLQNILETCWHTACLAEESRYPKFNLLVGTKEFVEASGELDNYLHFSKPKRLSINELRRLAPATDPKKSAILCYWDAKGVYVSGIYDLGTSWYRARMGLAYKYDSPNCLYIEVERPGKLRVYQGQFLVGELKDGEILGLNQLEMSLFFHPVTTLGLKYLRSEITPPQVERPKEFSEFEFIALANTFIAIASEISDLGHGGMVVILESETDVDPKLIRTKYEFSSEYLRSSFLKFINERHLLGDLIARFEMDEEVSQEELLKSEMRMIDSHNSLVEATRLVSRLSGSDGSIIITSDLQILGFGAEIKAELSEGTSIEEVEDELRKVTSSCDIEQFGMRHRSALKLVSNLADCKVLVVSQDGPVSGVWCEEENVLIKKGIKLANLNIPWA